MKKCLREDDHEDEPTLDQTPGTCGGSRKVGIARRLVDTIFCTCQNDQSGLISRRRVTVYADSRENQLVKMVADEWW